MKSLEEILKGLDQTDLFVIFLSRHALESDWVKLELQEAITRLNREDLKRVYPIIIDPSITHSDARIPERLKSEYNLRYISQPTLAVKRIMQRLRELAWLKHPSLRHTARIFVGRNGLVSEFERRIDNIDLPPPTAIIASGLKTIGRKSLVKHCLIKSNLYSESYEPSLIRLSAGESIEDFILKLHDLGFSSSKKPDRLMIAEQPEKIKIVTQLLSDIQSVDELVLVDDEGVLVNGKREVAPWILDALRGVLSPRKPLLGIISKYRPNPSIADRTTVFFSIEVPALDVQERQGLLGAV